MPHAYSYIRFSRAKQALGDSERRQHRLAVEYAQTHNLTLSTESYEDLGISAFRSKNATGGRLRAFLDAVDSGVIPRGSYLLVESLDRLSRDDVDEALELLLSIIRRGVSVVTLSDNQVYSKDTVKKDKGISLIVGITIMVRANDESALKSQRVREAWRNKRQKGLLLTSRGPAWLKIARDRRSWTIVESKANVVRRAFELALQGYGLPTIARKMNAEGLTTLELGRPWSIRTVHKRLTDPVVIGTMQAEDRLMDPIVDYYPAIISPNTFYRVREAMQRRRHVGGGPASEYTVNILAGLLHCHACGSRMRVMGAKGKYRYLSCLSAYNNSGCDQPRVPYRPVELTVLGYLRDRLLPVLGQNYPDGVDHAAELRIERDAIRRRLDNLLDSLADVRTPALIEKINEHQIRLNRVTTQIEAAVPPAMQQNAVGAAAELIRKLLKSVHRSDFTREERLLLRDAIKQVIFSVLCWTDADGTKWCLIYQHNYSPVQGEAAARFILSSQRTLGRERVRRRPDHPPAG